MTKDYSGLIHLKLCDNELRHRSHDWFDCGQTYRCIGVTEVWREQMPSSIIRKSCDLKVVHTLHIWDVPFLDGRVRYFCPGISKHEVDFLGMVEQFYGKAY